MISCVITSPYEYFSLQKPTNISENIEVFGIKGGLMVDMMGDLPGFGAV